MSESTYGGESLTVWQAMPWWPKEARVLAGHAGHDREITVGFDESGTEINDIIEGIVRMQLPASWRIENRSTRLELHPTGTLAGGYDIADVGKVCLILLDLGLEVSSDCR